MYTLEQIHDFKGKYPKQIWSLFFSEMWERFCFYGMRGMLVFFMIHQLDFQEKEANLQYGATQAFVYAFTFIGGLFADKILGFRKSLFWGGLLMIIGSALLAYDPHGFFFFGLSFIIIGTGFFKPNISTMVGELYRSDDSRRDAGFSLFYAGINLGAFICNIVAAFMRNQYGWGAAFITAGVGMFVGLIIFYFGRKHLENANVMKPVQEGDISLSRILGVVFLPAILCGAIGWMIPGNIFKSDSTDAFIFACIPIIIFYVRLYLKANFEDKRPLGALLAIFAVGMLFWAVFKQNGTALTRWANYYTDRQVTGTTEKALSSIYLVEEK